MTERTLQGKPMPTIWRAPDEPWGMIEPILQEYGPPRRLGRPRVDQRALLDAVVFRLRTGCQWNRMPKEFPMIPPCIGPSSGGSSLGCSTEPGQRRSRNARSLAG